MLLDSCQTTLDQFGTGWPFLRYELECALESCKPSTGLIWILNDAWSLFAGHVDCGDITSPKSNPIRYLPMGMCFDIPSHRSWSRAVSR